MAIEMHSRNEVAPIERRCSVRMPVSLRVSLYYDRLGLLSCTTRNVSIEGMLVDTGRMRLTREARVEVVVTHLVEDYNDPIRVMANVVRVNETQAALLFRNMEIDTFRRLKALLGRY